MSCNNPSEITRRGLDHTSNMSDAEHRKFTSAFRIFREQTDFENEIDPKMLKYYVQMAFFEGWKKRVINEE